MNNVIEYGIGEVIALMRVKLGTDAPFYIYGHPVEIANRTRVKPDPSLKYPLIALRLDTPVDMLGDSMSYNLNLAIINSTSSNYTSEQRRANVFDAVLQPLYELFMKCLVNPKFGYSWDFKNFEKPPHTKTDRYFYGTLSKDINIENLFSDPIDAIEIENLKINKRITC